MNHEDTTPRGLEFWLRSVPLTVTQTDSEQILYQIHTNEGSAPQADARGLTDERPTEPTQAILTIPIRGGDRLFTIDRNAGE